MKNSIVAFNLLDRENYALVGYKEMTCHLIFDVKMDLTRKARYEAGGHLVNPHYSMTYASVVSHDSVRLAFLIVAVNELDILSGDIQNAYSNDQTKEKLFFYAGDECKNDQGVIIVTDLYGFKSNSLAWRNHISDLLGNHLGFQSSLADLDVGFNTETYKTWNEYYTYFLVNVDDLLIFYRDPQKYMVML